MGQDDHKFKARPNYSEFQVTWGQLSEILTPNQKYNVAVEHVGGPGFNTTPSIGKRQKPRGKWFHVRRLHHLLSSLIACVTALGLHGGGRERTCVRCSLTSTHGLCHRHASMIARTQAQTHTHMQASAHTNK